MTTHTTKAARATITTPVVYECPDCGERLAGQRRCPDCNLFTTRLGTGGHCPECDEIILIDELVTDQPTAPSDTDNLTSSGLSAVLEQWPAEAPLVPKTAGDRARLALIDQPGTIRLSDWATTDRARANRRARSYTTADPRKLDPTADGAFEARVYHDTHTRKYRIAVRYTPTAPAATHHDTDHAEQDGG